MNAFSIDQLHQFILKAKQATYVGSGNKLLPYRLGSHDLQFFAGDWAYHDSYLGESDFIGGEVVYYQEKIVWGMNYLGRILIPEQITSAQAGAVIKESLTQMYQEGRFLGGFRYVSCEFLYEDASEGDVAFFTGREQISRSEMVVYELVYHGGLVEN